MLLETRSLRKDYGDTIAVHDLDLRIEAGEIFGLLGPNGAGKTTAISMIAGIVRPTRGSAIVAGHDVQAQPFRARRAVGLVPQDLAVYGELSALENLRYFGSLYGLRGRDLERNVEWALDVAGLRERAHERVTRFSGGMKRRLNISVGLVHKPQLLVLDEPTVGVDPQSRKHIFDEVRLLARDLNIGILYTSHYMEEVQTLCERIAIVDRGRVCAEGTVEALIHEHGRASLDVEYRGEREALAPIGDRYQVIDVSETRLRVAMPNELAPLLRAIESSGVTLVSIKTNEANLENAFLALTGHSLRDDG